MVDAHEGNATAFHQQACIPVSDKNRESELTGYI